MILSIRHVMWGWWVYSKNSPLYFLFKFFF